MKNIIAMIILVIGLVNNNAYAVEISSDEAYKIKQKVKETFSPYGLQVIGSSFRERSTKVFLSFCLYNEEANFYVFSHRERASIHRYEEEGTDFVLKKGEDGKFKKIHKGFEKGFFGKKETFMEIGEYYEKLPSWGLELYEIEVEILTRQNIYMSVFSSSGKNYPREFLFKLEYLSKKEERQTVFQLEAEIEKILEKQGEKK